ncbi:MAG: hypothetical protein CEN91_353 [Candidatus Berkelbacteria bacterium Licking1014_85]|uniref:Prepilin-type N-terminal cleavage/methylation domain-containing protein n=1 Tax=Candidatus Berkelbacteria bacterium Licking1014_85 TaxID=2017148 RepID=A0A554LJ33_9BACT|nr:MAG: hypothetical protein CEN91_353 [Candidatus Berkelbacteria bacterium Licking1014_85]
MNKIFNKLTPRGWPNGLLNKSLPKWRRLFGSEIRLNKRNGFTLIEILIASGIFALVAVIAAGSFASTLKINKRIAQKNDVQMAAMTLLEQIIRDVRQAESLTVDVDSQLIALIIPNSTNLTYKTYSVSEKKLMFCETDGCSPSDITPPDIEIPGWVLDGENGNAGNKLIIRSFPYIKIDAQFQSTKTISGGQEASVFEVKTMAVPRNFKKDYKP